MKEENLEDDLWCHYSGMPSPLAYATNENKIEMENLEQHLDLEYLFNNYIKARSSSNPKTRHRSYTLLHTALLIDMDYLDAKKFTEETQDKP